MESRLVYIAIFLTLPVLLGWSGRAYAYENVSSCGSGADVVPKLGWLQDLSATLTESVSGRVPPESSRLGESVLSSPSPTPLPSSSPEFEPSNETDEKPSDRYDLSDAPPKNLLSRLRKSAQAAAAACRTRRGRTLCGVTRSKYLCYRGVKEALAGAGLVSSWWPEEAAIDAHRRGTLQKKGFRNLMTAANAWDEWNAPIGAVLVYAGGLYNCEDERKHPMQCGHIEIKLSATKYCSDYCKSIPVSVNLDRRLVGIYVKE